MKSLVLRLTTAVEDFLRQNGVTYMYPNIKTKHFVIFCFVCGICFGFFSLPLFLVGVLLPVIIIRISNAADNDEMIKDIESIYDTIRIQARAGVHVQDSLMDCYMFSKNQRLKSALIEMCNQISTSKTMEEATEDFRGKFNNRNIDMLCIVLCQAESSGKTIQILSDMSEQIKQLRHSNALKEKGKLERKIEILELLIFVGVLAIGIFVMSNEITKMMNF